jgi:hypothetical protein
MGKTNRISYITIDTTGTVTDFGDLTVARKNLGASSDGTTAIFMGGESGETTMDYVTIGTSSTACQVWGYQTGNTYTLSGGSYNAGNGVISNGVRGVMALGGSTISGNYLNTIEYITFATPANSADFGDLYQGRSSPMQCSDGSRGVWGGGKYTNGGGSSVTRIDYLNIATPDGTSTKFGDLSASRYAGMGGISDSGADKS